MIEQLLKLKQGSVLTTCNGNVVVFYFVFVIKVKLLFFESKRCELYPKKLIKLLLFDAISLMRINYLCKLFNYYI